MIPITVSVVGAPISIEYRRGHHRIKMSRCLQTQVSVGSKYDGLMTEFFHVGYSGVYSIINLHNKHIIIMINGQ